MVVNTAQSSKLYCSTMAKVQCIGTFGAAWACSGGLASRSCTKYWTNVAFSSDSKSVHVHACGLTSSCSLQKYLYWLFFRLFSFSNAYKLDLTALVYCFPYPLCSGNNNIAHFQNSCPNGNAILSMKCLFSPYSILSLWLHTNIYLWANPIKLTYSGLRCRLPY